MNQPTKTAAANPATRNTAAVFGLAILFAAGLMLSGCNTTAGAGQDISNAGKDLSKAAVDTKNKL